MKPGAKRPTIHDVAERAGVSKSLVALVFKSDSGVSAKRREIVLQAAKELGYTPQVAFAEGLADVVQWYRDNRWWWEPLKERAAL